MKNKTTEKKSLCAQLSIWLEKQGYPLEMVVERVLRSSGFRTFQSDYYIDPQSNDSREIDVYAYKEKEIAGTLVRISICAECKFSRDKPWVLFTHEKTGLAAPARVVQRACSVFGKELLCNIRFRKEAQKLKLFNIKPRPASGITQAFTNGQDIAYSACLGVAKCASAKTKKSNKIFEIVIPVIIIDGKLFETYLDVNGQTIIAEISNSTLLWRNRLLNASAHTIIKIMNTNGINDFIYEVNEAMEYFISLENEIKIILKSHKAK